MLTLYQRLLQERLQSLPLALRQILSENKPCRATGRLTVTRARGRLRNLAAAALGIPPAGDYDLILEVLPHNTGQRWVRRFGSHVLETVQSDDRGLLVERAGLGSLAFELVVEGAVLLFRPRRAWLFGIRLPLWLSPCIDAENHPADDNSWRVCVRFRVPLLGEVARYEGTVTPQGALSPDAARQFVIE